MKLANLLTILLLIFTTSMASAQTLKSFKKEMKGIATATKMTTVQYDELTKIYEKRVADLQNIKALESQDEPAFRVKRRAVYSGGDVSIKRLLSKEQLELYVDYKRIMRVVRAKKFAKLKKKNASKDDLLDAELGIQ